jgi:hypothetical protein
MSLSVGDSRTLQLIGKVLSMPFAFDGVEEDKSRFCMSENCIAHWSLESGIWILFFKSLWSSNWRLKTFIFKVSALCKNHFVRFLFAFLCILQHAWVLSSFWSSSITFKLQPANVFEYDPCKFRVLPLNACELWTSEFRDCFLCCFYSFLFVGLKV